jgi:PQQ-dependent dehydrogenase (methanol/ethanol family)
MRPLPILLSAALFTGAAAAQTTDGKQQYQARCVGCHGEDGSGGGHGPSILNSQRSATAVRDLILNGIPDRGMPGFRIPAAEADAIAAHVLTFRSAPTGPQIVAGDPAAGARFFNGKGNCAACHMVNGRGGIVGPDLTDIGRRRTPAQLESALRNPTSDRTVTVRLRTGQTLRGIAKNETQFDLQLLGIDDRLHLLTKDAIAGIVREKALMPPLAATPEETRDLVAYLASPKSGPPAELGPGVPFSEIVRPQPGSWPTYDGTLTGNRYSSLDQINAANVGRLAPKWMYTVPGQSRALQVTPVVVDGIMYVTAANTAVALDARAGREIWRYTRPRTPGLAGDAAGGINRGVAVLGDRVFLVTDNAHLLSLHRLTGQLIWDVEMADSRRNYGATGAPLVVNDLVIAGVSGGDEGIRGFLDAYRASTGERVWRFWTIPAAGEPGSETWLGRAIEHGCGATWLTGTYDPEARLLYWPTGNPCPDYNGGERKGDNLYTASILALDPATGKLRWHYQFTPHDLHDWDATEPPLLVDATFRGESRKLLIQANRNGFFYVLDRLTGKLLLAEPFVKRLTWASGIGRDGRPQLLPGNQPTVEGQLSCPAVAGAANWPSAAFHPTTGLFYFFAEESCNIYSKNDQWWEAGKSFYGGGTRRAPGEPSAKLLKAIDIQTGKVAWEIPGIGGNILGSGLMATAGGLLFFGDGSGAFLAADARAGKLLWHFNTGQSFRAGPMTYTIDGKQHVAIAAGPTILSFALSDGR